MSDPARAPIMKMCSISIGVWEMSTRLPQSLLSGQAQVMVVTIHIYRFKRTYTRMFMYVCVRLFVCVHFCCGCLSLCQGQVASLFMTTLEISQANFLINFARFSHAEVHSTRGICVYMYTYVHMHT